MTPASEYAAWWWHRAAECNPGATKSAIAAKMGMTTVTLASRLHRETTWDAADIAVMTRVLGLDSPRLACASHKGDVMLLSSFAISEKN